MNKILTLSNLLVSPTKTSYQSAQALSMNPLGEEIEASTNDFALLFVKSIIDY